jgi:CheY-like chemotaxis protein
LQFWGAAISVRAVQKKRGQILLVDDDANDVLLVTRAFKAIESDDQIQHAQDGEEAVAYLEGTGPFADREKFPMPSLVLLDLKLPRMTGFEVLSWVRSQVPLKRLPIVIVTSSNVRNDVNYAYELGANSYVTKPNNLGALTEIIRTLRGYWCALVEQPDIN